MKVGDRVRVTCPDSIHSSWLQFHERALGHTGVILEGSLSSDTRRVRFDEKVEELFDLWWLHELGLELISEAPPAVIEEPKNNDGRETCHWCDGKTQSRLLLNNFADICVSCGR